MIDPRLTPPGLAISPRSRASRPWLAAGLAAIAAGGLALSACQVGETARAGDPNTAPTISAAPDRQAALTEAADEYLGRHPGLVASISMRHGDTTIEYGAQHRYQTASIVKVEILVRWLLLRPDAELPDDEYELAERMITASDNEATSDLCRVLAEEPETEPIPGATGACVGEPGWGVDETTAGDQRRIVTAALGGELLDESGRKVVKDLMGAVEPHQTWGVSAAANDGEDVWLKNGWDVRVNGWLSHSEGVIDSHDGEPVYLAILSNGNKSEAEGIAHVEDLADIARDALSVR